MKVPRGLGDDIIDRFEALARDAAAVQRDTLCRILHENADAEYLRKFGLEGRTDADSYRRFIPLSTHADVEEYIRRIADGDASPLLTGKPVTSLSRSSGTTQGRPKLLPFNDDLLTATMEIYRTSYAYRNREFPLGDGKTLQFVYGSAPTLSKGDLVVTTATTHLFRSERFTNALKDIQTISCSPVEVVFGGDASQSLYCHLLCGLIYSDEVQYVFSTFSHSIIHAFRTLELVWEELCRDIRTGELSSRITVPSMRQAMAKIISSPNPELADAVHRKCSSLSDSNWYGVIPSLWPNAKYVYGILTGSMEPYLHKLRHYAGQLPLMSADYGASEGWIGANIHPSLPPEQATFAVLPHIAYFEFIPLEEPSELSSVDQRQVETINRASAEYKESEPVGLTDVIVGNIYEVVITNSAGLYRYRMGDIVKVTGFHHSTPELQFVCRRSLILTINIDKNTEKDLQMAVAEAGVLVAAEKREVVDYTSLADMSSEPGHYVVFWELSSDSGAHSGEYESLMTSCASAMDLAFKDGGYMSARKSGGIGPLELRVLRGGTFQKVMDHYLSLGSTVSQFKTPRFVGPSNSSVLEILNSNVSGKFFSTAYGGR